jgi:SAM-dependent methyltransferase
MEIKDESRLLHRCEESLGTSKKVIYNDCWEVIGPHATHVRSALDMAAGTGNFKRFLADKVTFPIDECDYSFGSRDQFYRVNLNETFDLNKKFDLITILEAMQYFENPRHVLRQAAKHLNSSGILLVSIPNLHSFTSTLSFIIRGCHSEFAGKNYPSQITPIHKIDLIRMMKELGFMIIGDGAVREGRMPGTHFKWQDIPIIGRFFRHSIFCDNIYVIGQKENNGSNA